MIWIWLVVAGLVWAAGYFVACWWWPLVRACWRCDARGTLNSPSGEAYRMCPRCKGDPVKLRIGRRVYLKMKS